MDLDSALTLLSQQSDAPLDIAELSLELARDEYPELDVEAYLSELASMAHEALAYLRGDFETQVQGLCRYLFHDMGFHGNSQEYYDPRNCYFNQVLDRKTGMPITLSALVMALGARAGLHIVGVSLPGHFVVKAIDNDRETIFDPFHGGRLLTAENCEQLVEQVTGAPFQATAETLGGLDLRAIVVRMLSNLKGIYLRGEDFARAIRVIERIRQLDPKDPSQERDLGISLLRAGQVGKGVDYLAAYLASAPLAADAADVEKIRSQAMKELARWN
jgi:regulator of sirC expression with transglutaminase-like and TPR domain